MKTAVFPIHSRRAAASSCPARSTTTWARRLASPESRCSTKNTGAASNAVRWFRSPARLGAAETKPAPARRLAPTGSREELDKRIAELTKRHLDRQLDALDRLPDGPARDVQLLLIGARLGEIPFAEARARARKSIDAAKLPLRDRDDLEALLGLFDYYAPR